MSKRNIIILAVCAYSLGAAITFNFAHPIDCAGKPEFWQCAGSNIKQSAVSAAIWPAYVMEAGERE